MTQEYAPPKGFRHLQGLVARNLIPETAPTFKSYTTRFVLTALSEDLNTPAQVLYTSERITGTLNPEWSWHARPEKSELVAGLCHPSRIRLSITMCSSTPRDTCGHVDLGGNSKDLNSVAEGRGRLKDDIDEEVFSLEVIFDKLVRVANRFPAIPAGCPPNSLFFNFIDGFYITAQLHSIIGAELNGGALPSSAIDPASPVTRALSTGPTGKRAGEPRKILPVNEVATELGRFLAACERQKQLEAKREEVKKRMAKALEDQASRKGKLMQLGEVTGRIRSLRERIEKAASARPEIEAQNAQRRQELSVQSREIAASLRKLVNARQRLKEASRLLGGSKGIGLLQQEQKSLCARRWHLMNHLSNLYCISTLDLQLPAENGLSGQKRISDSSSNLAICDVPLDPNICRRRNATDRDQDELAATALGYVAHVVALVAIYLDVPLRYPVQPAASRSFIRDMDSFTLTKEDRKRGQAQGVCTLGKEDFPLFSEGVERTRFAYGVFLLNKDIEQLLNAHGINAVGPRHTLQNLQKLMSAQQHIAYKASFKGELHEQS